MFGVHQRYYDCRLSLRLNPRTEGRNRELDLSAFLDDKTVRLEGRLVPSPRGWFGRGKVGAIPRG
jgi:hypothetical protein